MNYAINDNELNGLYDCASQIQFVAGLCDLINQPMGSPVSISGLGSFLNEKSSMIEATIKAAEERHTAERVLNEGLRIQDSNSTQSTTLTPSLIMDLIEVACGKTTDPEVIFRVLDGLTDAIDANQAFEKVSLQLRDLLSDKGMDIKLEIQGHDCKRSIVQKKTKTASPRKRERLASSA